MKNEDVFVKHCQCGKQWTLPQVLQAFHDQGERCDTVHALMLWNCICKSTLALEYKAQPRYWCEQCGKELEVRTDNAHNIFVKCDCEKKT